MTPIVLSMEDTHLEDDVVEEVEGVAGGDIVLCEDREDDHFVETLANHLDFIQVALGLTSPCCCLFENN